MPTARAPSCAARTAISAPKPGPAPVTTTERPTKRRGMGRGGRGMRCPSVSWWVARSAECAAAVDVETLAGDERRPVGDQEADRVRDLFGPAQALCGHERLELLTVPVAVEVAAGE